MAGKKQKSKKKSQKKRLRKTAEERRIDQEIENAVLVSAMRAVAMGIDVPCTRWRPQEKKPGRCPVCNARCQYSNINLRDRMVTCLNNLCCYPYGYEDFQIVQDSRWTPADDYNFCKIMDKLNIDEEIYMVEHTPEEPPVPGKPVYSKELHLHQMRVVKELYDLNISGFGSE